MAAVFNPSSSIRWTDYIGKAVALLPLIPLGLARPYANPAVVVTLKQPPENSTSDETLYGRYDGQVAIGSGIHWTSEESHPNMPCEILPHTQKWCIG